jgi:hypothetical protein
MKYEKFAECPKSEFFLENDEKLAITQNGIIIGYLFFPT